jgi:hypothetical protein
MDPSAPYPLTPVQRVMHFERVAVKKYLDRLGSTTRSSLRIEVVPDKILGDLAAELTGYVLSDHLASPEYVVHVSHTEHFSRQATWFQHLKSDLLGKRKPRRSRRWWNRPFHGFLDWVDVKHPVIWVQEQRVFKTDRVVTLDRKNIYPMANVQMQDDILGRPFLFERWEEVESPRLNLKPFPLN